MVRRGGSRRPKQQSGTTGITGYSKGDFFPLFNFDVNIQDASTTSDTYTRVFPNTGQYSFSYDSVYPDDAQPAVVLTAGAFPNGDTLFVRFKNRQDNDVYLKTQITGSSFEFFKVGPGEFENDINQPVHFHAIEIKNADDTTTVTLASPSVRFGIIL